MSTIILPGQPAPSDPLEEVMPKWERVNGVDQWVEPTDEQVIRAAVRMTIDQVTRQQGGVPPNRFDFPSDCYLSADVRKVYRRIAAEELIRVNGRHRSSGHEIWVDGVKVEELGAWRGLLDD